MTKWCHEELSNAIRDGAFVMHYQPIVTVRDPANPECIAFESLVRWQRSETLLAPGQFLHEISRHGLAIELGDWIIRAVCEQVKTWQSQGQIGAHKVYINVCREQLQDEQMPTRVCEVIRNLKMHPSMYGIELSESAEFAMDSMRERVAALRACNLRVAFDDMGSNNAHFRLLAKLPVQLVKIDASYVAESDTPGGRRLLGHIIDHCRESGMFVTAEGVETIEQRDRLIELKCFWQQGYFHARPLTADGVVEYLSGCNWRDK
jgi:EAL domain-containing protein (putative c-di-GMP-specific phosphodiesterase class I)